MERIKSIDILKVFAILLIINSHMKISYVHLSSLATGGAIGNALFFFCSGFTIFLRDLGRFDNYYKKRIKRIFPAIIALLIIDSIFSNMSTNFIRYMFAPERWFIPCIMIYYVGLYICGIFFQQKLKTCFYILSTIIMVEYFFYFREAKVINIFGDFYFKWFFYFLFMMLGAYVGKHNLSFKSYKKKDAIIFLLSLFAFYVINYMCVVSPKIQIINILSLIPLFGVVFHLYKICNSSLLIKMYEKRIVGGSLFFIGSLSLEAYLIQTHIITDKLNFIFPLNVPLIMLLVISAAYVLHVFALTISQTFEKGPYDWESIFYIKNNK